MSNPSLYERLSAHKTLSAAPPDEIAWVAAHGAMRRLEPGDVLTPATGPVEGLHVVLSGLLSIQVDRGAGRRKIMEWQDGDVTGLLPYSRLVSPPGDVVAEKPTELVTVYRDELPAMIRECHELTAVLVHVMLDRARHFTSSFLHDEKLVSLGKLAAGLAHELNNPASAVSRSANALAESLMAAEAAARSFGAAPLRPEQIAAVERVRRMIGSGGTSSVLSPLEQEDRVDAIERWLRSRRADADLADSLANTEITIPMLNEIAQSVEGQTLNDALRWIATGCTTWQLASEIHEAASRISDLVDAIKGFTEMDRATVPEPVNVTKGLESTLVVLRGKAKGKSIRLVVDIEANLPRVSGFGGELNQVWANLVDNAIDAAGNGGEVQLSANRKDGQVVVRVIDNGPGIPADIRGRIFDPFFTTKPVGQGTGLGLDIVRRLVQRHSGKLELDSKPGRTEFCVTLPIADAH